MNNVHIKRTRSVLLTALLGITSSISLVASQKQSFCERQTNPIILGLPSETTAASASATNTAATAALSAIAQTQSSSATSAVSSSSASTGNAGATLSENALAKQERGTNQEILRQSYKRVKLSPEEEQEAREENWVLSYIPKLSANAKENFKDAAIRAIKNDRANILPAMLYDLLKGLPRELTDLIAAYEKPYTIKEELDHPFNINLPKGVTITAITALLLPHGNTIIIGFSNGYLQIYKENCESKENWELKQIVRNDSDSSSIKNGLIAAGFKVKTKWFNDKAHHGSHGIYIYKENGEKGAKKHWELQQTVKAHTTAITAMVSLRKKKIATSSDEGIIKVWGLNDKQSQYELKKNIPTGFKIKKLATAPDGNIVLLGKNISTQEEDDSFYLSVWNPVSGTCLFRSDSSENCCSSCENGCSYGLSDFAIYSDGRIVAFGGGLPYVIDNASGDYESYDDEVGHDMSIDLSSNKLYNSCTLPNDNIVTILPLKSEEYAALMLYCRDNTKVDCLAILFKEYFTTVIALQDGKIALGGPDWFCISDPEDRTDEYTGRGAGRDHDIQQLLQLPDGRLVMAYKDRIEILN